MAAKGPNLIKTRYDIITASGIRTTHYKVIPEKPQLAQLKNILEDVFERNWTEHVNVWLEEINAYTDMFVDENGRLKRLQRNEEATKIYRANWLKQHPKHDPESLGFVLGTAVLFYRKVWY